jgi:hypothetical protein
MERQRPGPLRLAVLGIALIAVLYLVLLGPIFEVLIAFPDWAKIMISLALIAPLASLMGMPFPLGLAQVASQSEDLLPWAWGINGCASVVASILATLLAIHFGLAAVVSLAVALYLLAPLLLGRAASEPALALGPAH